MRTTAWGTLAIGTFFGGMSWWYHQRLLQSLGVLEVADQSGAQELLVQFARQSVTITAVASVGTVLFVTLLSLFLVHRISGPIYRLKQHLLGMVMGRPPTELTFRRDDQLADLCAAVNQFLRHFDLIGAASETVSEEPTPEMERRQVAQPTRT